MTDRDHAPPGGPRTAPLLVVRHSGHWTRTIDPYPAIRRIDLEDVLDLLDGAAPAPDLAQHPPLSGSVGLRPAWAVVTRVDGGVLRWEDPDGQPVALDADDVRLLDAVSSHPTLDQLVAAGLPIARDVAARRMARLRAVGALAELPGALPPPRRHDVPDLRVDPATTAPAPAPDPNQRPVPEGRVPVYAAWHRRQSPPLSLGMLLATLRAANGQALHDRYDIRHLQPADDLLDQLPAERRPAVLLCSNYVWSVEENLELARRAVERNPDLVVVHGGPSTPKYEADAQRFLDANPTAAHVLVRGEGEATIVDLLAALGPTLPGLDPEALAQVPGITFRGPDGAAIRTADRPRSAELDTFPSPYLTGEFDHIAPDAWSQAAYIETNRGCPYGCTFCDWGSATQSRIRKFALERVQGEIEWIAQRRIGVLGIADANFGIVQRDVEVVRRLAEVKKATGFPELVVMSPAKNTVRHLTRIVDLLIDAELPYYCDLGIQSTDPTTLAAIDRSNIATTQFVELAAAFRRRGHPLQCDLMLGLPGQTVTSFAQDLQFMLDHEILHRTWLVRVLPNSPMNAPEYRTAHAIEFDDLDRVVATSSFTRADRDRMLRLGKVNLVAEQFGLLRHVLRFVQWDLGIEAWRVLLALADVVHDDPLRYPLLTWVFTRFDELPTVVEGWTALYEEVRAFLATELDVRATSGLDTVLRLQAFLMPKPGRSFPATIELDHDVVAYHRSAVAPLYTTGRPEGPSRPLEAHGPASLTVEGDPLDLCRRGLVLPRARHKTTEGELAAFSFSAHELLSPLTATVAQYVLLHISEPAERAAVRTYLEAWAFEVGEPAGQDLEGETGGTPVRLGRLDPAS